MWRVKYQRPGAISEFAGVHKITLYIELKTCNQAQVDLLVTRKMG